MEEKKPVKKTTAKKTTAAKTDVKTEKPKAQEVSNEIAVFSTGKLHHPVLGRLNSGYSVLDRNLAEEWMKISKKVREASPQEVASAYGV